MPKYKLKLHVDKMALLKYLQKIDKPKDKEDCDAKLPSFSPATNEPKSEDHTSGFLQERRLK